MEVQTQTAQRQDPILNKPRQAADFGSESPHFKAPACDIFWYQFEGLNVCTGILPFGLNVPASRKQEGHHWTRSRWSGIPGRGLRRNFSREFCHFHWAGLVGGVRKDRHPVFVDSLATKKQLASGRDKTTHTQIAQKKPERSERNRQFVVQDQLE